MTALHPAAPPALATPTGAWRKLSAAMTAEIPAIAGRPVPVACAPGAGLGHPACYLPGIPVIEVDGDLLGVSPVTASPASPADRERYPVIWGALTHEGGHAAHSKVCPPPAGTANWCEAAHLLEESPMEAAQVTRRPGDRRWLRHRQQAHPRRLRRRRPGPRYSPRGRLGRRPGPGQARCRHPGGRRDR